MKWLRMFMQIRSLEVEVYNYRFGKDPSSIDEEVMKKTLSNLEATIANLKPAQDYDCKPTLLFNKCALSGNIMKPFIQECNNYNFNVGIRILVRDDDQNTLDKIAQNFAAALYNNDFVLKTYSTTPIPKNELGFFGINVKTRIGGIECQTTYDRDIFSCHRELLLRNFHPHENDEDERPGYGDRPSYEL